LNGRLLRRPPTACSLSWHLYVEPRSEESPIRALVAYSLLCARKSLLLQVSLSMVGRLGVLGMLPPSRLF
jgi:hypothetical protein